MSPKRGDRAAPPPVGDEFDIRFANNEGARGWEQLARQAPANLRRAFEAIRAAPRSTTNVDRQHRMKGAMSTATWKGAEYERWQFEVTGAGRIWYLVDDDRRTAWVIYAGTGHPKETD